MDWLIDRFRSFGPALAGIDAEGSQTYEQLVAAMEAARATLPPRPGVTPVNVDPPLTGIASLLAIAASRGIALPLPAGLPGPEQARLKQLAGVGAEPSPPLYRRLAGAGLILFSSGTSGEPKGMLHDFDALLRRYRSVRRREERSLQLLPLDHIGGLDAALRCLCAGSTLVLPESRSPDAAGRAIETHRVTVLPASPTFLNLLLLADVPGRYDCSSVKIIAYGAEPMPGPLLERLGAAFPRADLQQKFGTSETGALQVRSSGRDSLYFRVEDPATEWQVVDGELWLRSPSRILGYLNAPDSALEADGWYRTGDLVEAGPDDSLRIVGRRSEVINVGGHKVHPSEVESILMEMDGLAACRVFAQTDPITGQRVVCELTPSDRSTAADAREWKSALRRHCRRRLPAWKIPTEVTLADSPAVTDRLKRQS